MLLPCDCVDAAAIGLVGLLSHLLQQNMWFEGKAAVCTKCSNACDNRVDIYLRSASFGQRGTRRRVKTNTQQKTEHMTCTGRLIRCRNWAVYKGLRANARQN